MDQWEEAIHTGTGINIRPVGTRAHLLQWPPRSQCPSPRPPTTAPINPVPSLLCAAGLNYISLATAYKQHAKICTAGPLTNIQIQIQIQIIYFLQFQAIQ